MYRKGVLSWKNQLELKYYDWKLKKLKGRSNLRVIPGSRSVKRANGDGDEDDDDGDGGGMGPQIH
jgi:hypothetical protein